MRHTPLLATLRFARTRRTGAFLLALSFLLVGSGGVHGGHDCAHHPEGGGAATHAPGHDPTIELHGSPGAHGSHGSHGAGPPDSGHEDSAPCTCVGTCHGSAATPVAPADTPPVAALRPSNPSAAPGSAALSQRLLPYVLPFANGPPIGA